MFSFPQPKRLCFPHMQKSAGSSAHDFIIRSLRTERGWNEGQYLRIWAADFVDRHIDEIRRGERRFVYGHFDPTPLFGEFKAVYFTIVRDPVERVISLYNFCATMTDETMTGITGVRDPAFEHCTLSTWSMATDMISMIETVRAGMSFGEFIRLPPQLFKGLESWPDYLAYLPKFGDPAEYARRFGVIGLAQDMDWTLRALAKRMGWAAPEAAPQVNRTPTTVVKRADLTDADLAVIERRTGFEAELYRIASAARSA